MATMKTQLCNDQIFTLDNVLDASECNLLKQLGDEKGWNKSAPSGGGHGRTGREDPRTNKFCVLENERLTQKLWDQVADHLPANLTFLGDNVYFNSITKGAEWTPKFVINKLRVYKYEVGNAFPEHIDYKVKRTVYRDGEEYVQQSFLTMLVYLNEDFTGGETGYWPNHNGIHCRFLRNVEQQQCKKEHQVLIKPKMGMAVIQDQNILHEGLPTKKGIKYILRTDIIHERHVVRNPKIATKNTNDSTGNWERLFETSCKNYAD